LFALLGELRAFVVVLMPARMLLRLPDMEKRDGLSLFILSTAALVMLVERGLEGMVWVEGKGVGNVGVAIGIEIRSSAEKVRAGGQSQWARVQCQCQCLCLCEPRREGELLGLATGIGELRGCEAAGLQGPSGRAREANDRCSQRSDVHPNKLSQ
jgi:hypothetical protein